MNYFDYMPKYQTAPGQLPKFEERNGIYYVDGRVVGEKPLSTEWTPERLFVEGTILGKPTELILKGLGSAVKFIAPKTAKYVVERANKIKSTIKDELKIPSKRNQVLIDDIINEGVTDLTRNSPETASAIKYINDQLIPFAEKQGNLVGYKERPINMHVRQNPNDYTKGYASTNGKEIGINTANNLENSELITHEVRHILDKDNPFFDFLVNENYLKDRKLIGIKLTGQQKKLLNEAYPASWWEDLTTQSAVTTREKVATNAEIRKRFYDEYLRNFHSEPTIEELNGFITNMPINNFQEIISRTPNAYMKEYLKRINTPEQLQLIKQALSTVPMGAGIIVTNKNYNYLDYFK